MSPFSRPVGVRAFSAMPRLVLSTDSGTAPSLISEVSRIKVMYQSICATWSVSFNSWMDHSLRE